MKLCRTDSFFFFDGSVARAVGAVSHRHVSELPAQERHGRAAAVRLRLRGGGAQQREEEEQGPPVCRDGGALLPLRH